MLTIYNFDLDTTDELLQTLARNMQRRRLEKGLSREALSELSGVPAPHCQVRTEICHLAGFLCGVGKGFGICQGDKAVALRTALWHHGGTGYDSQE